MPITSVPGNVVVARKSGVVVYQMESLQLDSG